MSILKIADEIDDLLKEQEQLPWGTKQVYLDLAATIIRKQQAEIEALKKDNKELHAIAQRMAMAESDARKSLQWFKDAQERQTEPVAWMRTNKQWRKEVSWVEKEGFEIPLYTHPADLTDKEILDVEKRLRNNGDFCELHFARAILRKAQEK